MQAQGYAPGTIKTELSSLSMFYRWCSEQGVDPDCGDDFNPLAALPKLKRDSQAKVLGPGEVSAFLVVLRQDQSNLGRRDYAFFLARLHLGVRHKTLQQLQWGQIELHQDGARVRWAAGREAAGLPAAVWEAIRSYLDSSGRLAGIGPQDYIFAPRRNPLNRGTDDRAEDWHADRCLSKEQIRRNLKIYGRLAGIPEDNLTLHVLRHTAAWLCLEAGAGWEQMQAFLESEAQPDNTRLYMRKLERLPREDSPGVGAPVELPSRGHRVAKLGEGIQHGFYAQKQPDEQVAALLAEDIQGMEDEFVGLRLLSRKLVTALTGAGTGEQVALLGEACTKAAARLGQLSKAERQREEPNEESEWVDEVLAMLDRAAIQQGASDDEEPPSEEFWRDFEQSDPEVQAASKRLMEEIASTRLVLRRLFGLAMETEQPKTLVGYADKYGQGCIRLSQLLKAEQGEQGHAAQVLREMIDEVIVEVNKEFGLDLGGGGS